MSRAESVVPSSRRPRDKGSHSRRSSNVIPHVVLCVGAVLMVGPFVWEVLTSFKTFAASIHVPPVLVPNPFDWHNYLTVFQTLPFGSLFLNTVLMTLARTAGQVIFCSLSGYAFARLRFPCRGLLFGLFLSVLMVPSQMFLIPQYQIIQHLGLLNTVAGLSLPGMFSAFGTFLMRQFFMQLPVEMEEAARLDGANPWQTFWHVMLPLSRPGMLALGILVAIWSWNDLLWPLVVNTDPAKMPLSAGLASLQGEHLTNYPVLMAGALLASLPLIVAFIVFQRHLIQGIASTGIKG
jgi:multiple sugar transport system permease protein